MATKLAKILFEIDSLPNCASTVRCDINSSGTGKAPELSEIESDRADVASKFPEITALPPTIASLTLGAETISPSKIIATGLLTFRVVISSNNLAPSLLKEIETTGSDLIPPAEFPDPPPP